MTDVMSHWDAPTAELPVQHMPHAEGVPAADVAKRVGQSVPLVVGSEAKSKKAEGDPFAESNAKLKAWLDAGKLDAKDYEIATGKRPVAKVETFEPAVTPDPAAARNCPPRPASGRRLAPQGR